MGEFVRVETEPSGRAIATIGRDRPPMNALNSVVQAEIAAAAAEVSADPEGRAVIVYGGEKVFAAGADIKEMADASYGQMAAATPRGPRPRARPPGPAAGPLRGRRQERQAGHRGDHRLRPGRRPGTGAVRRLPG